MASKKNVLIIGLDPGVIDFSAPDFAASPGLNADKIRAGLKADQNKLSDLGYDTDICLTDDGETAESVVAHQLHSKRYDCILIGAGIRTLGKYFTLFEKLINVVHSNAPQAKLCFNTQPSDSAEAVQRWV